MTNYQPYVTPQSTAQAVYQACQLAVERSTELDRLEDWATDALANGTVKARYAALTQLYGMELEEARFAALADDFFLYLPSWAMQALEVSLEKKSTAHQRQQCAAALRRLDRMRRDAQSYQPQVGNSGKRSRGSSRVRQLNAELERSRRLNARNYPVAGKDKFK